jgi:hypothetical protein
MVKKLLLLFLFFSYSFTYAETIKTDVLVIGDGASAVTAAMQCARSKIKTLLIVKGAWLNESMPAGSTAVIDVNRNLPSGIWGDFRREIRNFYGKTPGYDTTYNAPLKFETFTGAALLKKMADTVKNLTIKLNTPFTTIKKDGTGWEVSVMVNGKTDIIKAKIVIDATEKGDVVTKAGAMIPPIFSSGENTGSKLYRTSITTGDMLPGQKSKRQSKNSYPSFPAYYIPVNAIVVKDADNLLVTETAMPDNSIAYLPAQMELGQGAGTVAAYCAFFKTTTKNLKVRIIQGELLDFKGYLLPFDDIEPHDRYVRAIQQIGATGLLKGVQKMDGDNSRFLFLPDSAVATAEIKPVLTEIYSRAFLWFNKIKPGEQFTVGNLLSFISEITLSDPAGFQITIQKAWKSEYKFHSDFAVNHPVTRREFAILTNKFLNPFARKIDLAGNMVN